MATVFQTLLRSTLTTRLTPVAMYQPQIRTATKKAGGSTNNGRDSAGRRLGVKIMPNLPAKSGAIILRQRGERYKVGDNVGMGRDHTIYARIEGIVKFTKRHYPLRRKNKVMSVVNVYETGDPRLQVKANA